MTRPYPAAAWRLAPDRLRDVAIDLSHILVVHADSRSGHESNFRGPNWSAEPTVARSRSAALQRAAEIALEAQRSPARFADLARTYSDDLASREQGGALGVWTADVLPAELLDALATLTPGQTSRVVETSLGFHVLKRNELPGEASISARRILVSYQPTAPFARRVGHAEQRSREAARAMAEQLAASARAQPGTFSELVQSHSEHSDAVRGGDIGVWSNLRGFPLNRELKVLSSLRPGEVSQPIDSMEGFNVFLRTQVERREQLAAEEIQLQPASASAGARDATASLSRTILADLARRPQRFSYYQKTYCCHGRMQWEEGRGHPLIEQATTALTPMQISKTAVEDADGVLHIVRRLDAVPDVRALAPVLAELPAPASPNVEAMIAAANQGEQLAAVVAELAEEVEKNLTLSASQKSAFQHVVQQLSLDLRTIPSDQRVLALHQARSQFATILGSDLYVQLRSNVDRALKARLMGQ